MRILINAGRRQSYRRLGRGDGFPWGARMSNSIKEAHLKDVPLDKALAFVQEEKEASQKLHSAGGKGTTLEGELECMSHVLAAARECGIPGLAASTLPGLSDDGAFSRFIEFRQKARHLAHRLRIRAGTPSEAPTAGKATRKSPAAKKPKQIDGHSMDAREIDEDGASAADHGLAIVNFEGKPAFVLLSWEAYCRMRSGSPGGVDPLAAPGVRQSISVPGALAANRNSRTAGSRSPIYPAPA